MWQLRGAPMISGERGALASVCDARRPRTAPSRSEAGQLQGGAQDDQAPPEPDGEAGPLAQDGCHGGCRVAAHTHTLCLLCAAGPGVFHRARNEALEWKQQQEQAWKATKDANFNGAHTPRERAAGQGCTTRPHLCWAMMLPSVRPQPRSARSTSGSRTCSWAPRGWTLRPGSGCRASSSSWRAATCTGWTPWTSRGQGELPSLGLDASAELRRAPT